MLTLLWDNDGVLVDTEGLYFEACRETLQSVGIELTLEQFKEISLKRGESTFVLATQLALDPHELARMREERDRRYTELLMSDSPLIDGVVDVLRDLHGQVRMGVVTSSQRRHFEAAHAKSNILPYMDFVLTREDYAQSKPHPEPYLTALRQYDLTAEQCLVIEDSERGLAAASAAGLDCIVVLSRWTRDGDFGRAVAVVENIANVRTEVLKKLQAH